MKSLVLTMLSGCILAAADAVAAEKAYTAAEIARATKAGKDTLTRRLKDPGSVQYRGLFVSVRPARELDGEHYPESLVLCGEVNAKNSYGGYVGFQRFANGIVEGPSESDRIAFEEVVWKGLCERKIREVK